MENLVDIIIPLHNKRRVIDRAISSVLEQTFSEWRLWVIDDGSTDGWQLNVTDDRIRVVQQANAGPGAARNRGVAAGNAPLVAFLDADDEWLPSYLEVMTREILSQPDLAAVSCGWARRVAGVDTAGPAGIRPGLWMWSTATGLPEFKQRVDSLHSSATLVRRDSFRMLGGFYEAGRLYGEDSYLWMSLLMRERVSFVPKKMLVYHTDASQLSTGRASAYPLPPAISDPARILDGLDVPRRSFVTQYLDYYSKLVLARSLDEGAYRQVFGYVFSDGSRRVGLSRNRRLKLWVKLFAHFVRYNTIPGRAASRVSEA